ncbi:MULTISPECIES: hypothetical protein [unclassified Burkholderia]|uniref:hypothetical protein n=1 Tax=unclassified Burkholderia TaxID=2613784 RepID=UPI000F590074|nr:MULTISPECIES: hypothetical protein [unclassified Burkholderia]
MLTLQVLNSKVMWLVERECLVAVKRNGAQNRRKPILPYLDFHVVFGVERDFRARDVQAMCNRNSHPRNRSALGV